jgi:hypothetical protein
LIAAIASAALLVAASLVVGQAALVLAGLTRPTLIAGPVGLAVLLVVGGLVAGRGGQGTVIAVVLGALVVGSALVLLLHDGGSVARSRHDPAALAAALLAGVCAAIPFIAAGHVGILGVGLVNDDMASHLLLADWIDERFRPEPVLIDQGYPLGPHALVAGIDELLAARSIDVFAGLVLAIPTLTALVAYSALERVARVPRIVASALVALPYMAAAYLAQEAFKEPMIALFVIAFALLLPAMRRPRNAIALGVIAAGTVYVYSFPGLAWLVGTALLWGVVELWRVPEDRRRKLVEKNWRPLALAAAVAIAALAILALPDLARLLDFVDFRALHPDRANEGGLGNLPGQLSPLVALGIWPTSDFRLSAAASNVPAVIFYACALLAAAALLIGLPRWLRRHGPAIPAALATAVVLYLLALGFGTVYTSAKALAIAAPPIALMALGGLLAASNGSKALGEALPRRLLQALALAFTLAAAGSSFLILRQAPVAPEEHADELAEIRPLVAGEKLLFLGRDNFVLYELRGSKPFTHVRNFYDPYFVEPNFEIRQVGAKFDFDSVTAQTLARFPYVLTTRAAYASGPPPGYRVIARTRSYLLWERRMPPLGRRPAERDPEPGRLGGCPRRVPSRIAAFRDAPVVAPASDWTHARLENDGPASIELDLPSGGWSLSLQYDSTRPVTLSSPDVPGFSETVPGNLDYRGAAPFWPAGRIDAPDGAPVRISASVERPPLAGRLLGAHSVAHLGAIAATRPGDPRVGRALEPVPPSRLGVPPPPSCGDYVDWYVRR